MLSVIDVIKALTILVESNFPNYPVNDRDVTEGFERPSYFIDIEEVKTENVTAQHVKETAELVLVFFEQDIYKGFLNLLDMKNELIELLNRPLELTDENGKTVAHVVFNDVSMTVSNADKALTCTMSSELIQKRADEDEHLPLIDNVEFNTTLN